MRIGVQRKQDDGVWTQDGIGHIEGTQVYLISAAIKTHNIRELLALIPSGIRPGLEAGEQDRLTEYATVTRYPGDYETIPVAEARRSVAVARRVRKEIRRSLPKEVFRQRGE